MIGNLNAVKYEEVFPLIKGNSLWLGVNNGDMAFRVPPDSEPRATRYWQDKTGQKWRSLGNSCWFTNLEYDARHKPIPLTARYTPEAYPRYDNYDAIEVSRTKDIPCDYYGVMGVPISFLDKWCAEQFEIVGVTYKYGRPDSFPKGCRMEPRIGGKCAYKRILIRRRNETF